MKQKLILITCLMALTVGAWAQSAPRLVVWLKTGEKVYYNLSELPETSFEGGQLIIKTQTVTVPYLLENVQRYTYEGAGTGIDLQLSERSVNVTKDGNEVTLRNLEDRSVVSLYAANGVLLEQRTAEGRRPITVSIAQRAAGVYIVKCGTETIKLLKR